MTDTDADGLTGRDTDQRGEAIGRRSVRPIWLHWLFAGGMTFPMSSCSHADQFSVEVPADYASAVAAQVAEICCMVSELPGSALVSK